MDTTIDQNTLPSGFAPALPKGTIVGRYVLIDQIGEGGMAVVFSAFDPELNRLVGLKLLKAGTRSEPDNGMSSPQARLLREAQALAQLSHPNVVSVYDVGIHNDAIFIAMELLEGTSLRNWLKEKPRTDKEILRVLGSAGEGLAAAHRAGLVHRDFKPENVVVTRDGRIKVLDFGIARSMSPGQSEPDPPKEPSPAPTQPDSIDSTSSTGDYLHASFTKAGTLKGTYAYMAPEQWLGLEIDGRTDQFSFAVVLFEAMYGVRPFPGTSREELYHQIIATQVTFPEDGRRTRLGKRLRRILLKGLSYNPDKRYTSMEELLAELALDPTLKIRRMLSAILVVFLLAGALWGVGREILERRMACSGARRMLTGIWDEQAKNQVTQAFLSTGAIYSGDTLTRIERALEQYTQAWATAYEAACRFGIEQASDEAKEAADLEMWCLREHLAGLRALSQIFMRADKSVVEKAVEAVANLSGFEECRGKESLRLRIPPPTDEHTRRRVKELRGLLSEIKALDSAGKYKEGLVKAGEADGRARELSYKPVMAEARNLLGQLQQHTGEFAKAERSFEQAVLLADGARHDHLRARSSLQLIFLYSVNLAKLDAADYWSNYAEAAIERLGSPIGLRADWYQNVANIKSTRGEYRQALELQSQSLALLERAPDKTPQDIAQIRNSMGVELSSLGEYGKAAEQYREAINIWEKTLGPEHPTTAKALGNLGVVYQSLGDFDSALKFNQRALEIFRRIHGEFHPDVANHLENVGTSYGSRGDLGKAEEYLSKALTIWERIYGPDHQEVALTLHNLGCLSVMRGEMAKAVLILERCLRIREEKLGPEHPRVALTLSELGHAREGLGELDRALALHERALTIRRNKLGRDSPKVALSLKDLGQLYQKKANYVQALQHLEEGLSICEKKPCDSDTLPAIEFALAQTLTSLGKDGERALGLARESLKRYEQDHPNNKAERERVRGWLRAQGAR